MEVRGSLSYPENRQTRKTSENKGVKCGVFGRDCARKVVG